MNNWKEILENRLKACEDLVEKHIDFDAGTEHEYYEEVERFLNLEHALLQSLLNNLENFKPNELKGVSNNELTQEVCDNCGNIMFYLTDVDRYICCACNKVKSKLGGNDR